MTRFERPRYTQPAAAVVDGVAPQAPLPPLVEPAAPAVVAPVAEALVPVVHRRVRVLGNYWHAGWARAVAGCWLRQSAAERLGTVADSLPEEWGLAVFDAWRPLDLQRELYETAYADPNLPPGFVSFPDADPTTPPPHLTGGTVDLTLTYRDQPLALGGGFDDFTERAHAAALEDEPGVDRELRRLLYWAMRAGGFVVLDCEWWHFEYGTRRWAAITDNAPLYGPAEPA